VFEYPYSSQEIIFMFDMLAEVRDSSHFELFKCKKNPLFNEVADFRLSPTVFK